MKRVERLRTFIGAALVALLAQCEANDFSSYAANLGGISDLNNYFNLSLEELGNVGDISNLGDLSETGDAGPNPVFLNWAQQGLDRWEIGLNVELVQFGLSDSVRNWITVARDNCVAEGVPEELTNNACAFREAGVIGVCYIGFSRLTGEIQASLAIIEKSFLEGSNPEDEKIGVFVHEVGHCLGLKHTDEPPPITPCSGSARNCVMYSRISPFSTPGPHLEEIKAIQSGYRPVLREPTVGNARYFKENDITIRHHIFPDFYISGVIGRGATTGKQAGNESVPESYSPLLRRAYIMRSDGIEEIHTIYPDGSRELRYTQPDLE